MTSLYDRPSFVHTPGEGGRAVSVSPALSGVLN